LQSIQFSHECLKNTDPATEFSSRFVAGYSLDQHASGAYEQHDILAKETKVNSRNFERLVAMGTVVRI
jgi:hypothetical protein